MSKLIFSLEDDSSIGFIISKTLTNAGFQIQVLPTRKTFLAALANTIPDLILLDIMLPDGDGIQILQELKNNKEYKNIPVIIVSAKNYEVDKIIGLDSGADDYITKPFGVLELIARVKACLRRYENRSQVYRWNGLTLDCGSYKCLIDDQVVSLTSKEFGLLRMLIENCNKALARDQIFVKIWGFEYIGESRTLDVHINSLRRKIGLVSPHLAKAIETIRGVGYRAISYE